MTNSMCIAKMLSKKCDGKHEHQQLLGKRAEYAARYPKDLCRAICQGLIQEMRYEEDGVKSLFTLQGGDEVKLEHAVTISDGKACR